MHDGRRDHLPGRPLPANGPRRVDRRGDTRGVAQVASQDDDPAPGNDRCAAGSRAGAPGTGGARLGERRRAASPRPGPRGRPHRARDGHRPQQRDARHRQGLRAGGGPGEHRLPAGGRRAPAIRRRHVRCRHLAHRRDVLHRRPARARRDPPRPQAGRARGARRLGSRRPGNLRHEHGRPFLRRVAVPEPSPDAPQPLRYARPGLLGGELERAGFRG